MKLDRRSFLLLGTGATVGGAVGSMFTPLAWKLTDDASIWTQNWSWTPVPPGGEVSFTRSVCTLCPGGCGVKVRKVKTRPVKIDGAKQYAVNNGGICLLGLSGLQVLYSPSRVKAPMKRVGKRGKGEFVQITWDEAISEVAKKLGALRSSESHKVGCITGSGKGTVSKLFSRFMQAYGSPNLFWQATTWDTYETVMRLMHGVNGQAAFDLENSDHILSFSSGLLDGWGSPVRMLQAHGKWRDPDSEKTVVVQIESKMSNTAAKADKWIPINPGTEGALAMGMANVIITESLYDRSFINWYTEGFEDAPGRAGKLKKSFKRLVQKEYPLKKVADITGVSIENIKIAARDFAKAKRPVALFGRGNGDRPIPLSDAMAIHSLNALVGSINRPKGGVFAIAKEREYPWPSIKHDPAGRKGLRRPRIDGADKTGRGLANNMLNRLPEVINNSGQSPLKALLICDANPLYTLADTQKTAKALDKIDFIVSFSSHLDDTTAYADLILPDHVYLERLRDVPTPLGMNKPVTGLSVPVIKPVYKTRHVGDVILKVAKKMGGAMAASFPWTDYTKCLEQAMGDKWGDLQEKGVWVNAGYAPAQPSAAFKTPSGRFEFFSAPVRGRRRARKAIMPGYEKIKAVGDINKYPLTVIPCDSIRLATGPTGDTPFMMKTVSDKVLKKNDLVVEVNTRTAKQYGLSQGVAAVLSTPAGSARVLVNVTEEIKPELIGVPRGLGHTAYDKYLGGKGANYNTLISPVPDPATGLDVAWGIRAVLKLA